MRKKLIALTIAVFSVTGFSALAAGGSNTDSSKCPDEQAMLDSKPGITAAEREKIRTATFDALDQNKDGMVSRSEYVKCLVQSPAFDPAGKGAKAVK